MAFVPSDIACSARMAGNISRTAVWTSVTDMTDFADEDASSAAVAEMRRNTSWMKSSRALVASLDIIIVGCIPLRTFL